jgi:hypothetical protein
MLSVILVSALSLGIVDTAQTLHYTSNPMYMESNPIWGNPTDHPVAFVTIKTGLETAIVMAIAHDGRRHRKRAIIAGLLFAGIKGVIVYHNYRVTKG